MNNSIAVALMKNEEGRFLVAQTKQSFRQAAALSREEEYEDRKAQLKELIQINRIPTKAPDGCTSRAERLAKQFARAGGEEFENALLVLRFARVSKQDWKTALDCFA